MQKRYRRGFEYSDVWVQDARLVVLNAMDAEARGATVHTRTKVTSARRTEDGKLWTLTLQAEDGTETQTQARAVVNAGGPWAADIDAQVVSSNDPAKLRELVQRWAQTQGSAWERLVAADLERMQAKVAELGAMVSADYADRQVTLVSVLKGALPFMADLMRAISSPVRIDLMEVSSYGGATETSGMVRIPPGVDVPLTPRVRQLIDTSEFRRLARISQLGLVSLVYPAAIHTRFEHSLVSWRNLPS